MYSVGKYYDRVTGAIGGISGTDGEKTYMIVPLKSLQDGNLIIVILPIYD